MISGIKTVNRAERVSSRAVSVIVVTIFIKTPFPHVPGHVEQPVSVGGICADRRCGDVTVFPEILQGKFSPPNVMRPLAVRFEFISPRIRFPFKTSPGGIFPFGFGRQPFACPVAVGDGIVPGNMYDRVIQLILDGRFRTFRVSPVRTGSDLPEFTDVNPAWILFVDTVSLRYPPSSAGNLRAAG